MATFPDLPNVAIGPIWGGTRTYVLLEPLHHDEGTVPINFLTDGASVPRIFWPIFPHDGATFPAAIIHDWEYQNSIEKRKVVDKRFLANMKMLGLGWLHRHMIYRAVRIGAGRAWRGYRK